ncbi:MAG TPA: winged helix-turn-helix domain-containing protein [Trebonia sp.]|nr:winged helix-turn-helix domain-containing protein [Trebonia sp.]
MASLEEVTERVRISTHMLDQREAAQQVVGSPAQAFPGGGTLSDKSVPLPGTDGMLLAVVPIPGTGTSLAIVGYPVTAPGMAYAEPAADGAGLAAPLPRSAGAQASADGTADSRGGLLIDHDQRRVWTDGAEIPLTFQEFELLAFLSAHPSTVFSRADLAQRVWQRDFGGDSRTVDVHVSRLRHKLGPVYGKYLVTEYRVGYQFRPVGG